MWGACVTGDLQSVGGQSWGRVAGQMVAPHEVARQPRATQAGVRGKAAPVQRGAGPLEGTQRRLTHVSGAVHTPGQQAFVGQTRAPTGTGGCGTTGIFGRAIHVPSISKYTSKDYLHKFRMTFPTKYACKSSR